MRTRDAIEPLLSAFDMVGAERDGRIALAGVEPIVSELALDALALPDEGKALTRDRDMAARPSMARVRFIDEGAAYQIGSATLRSDGDGGTVDIDLPAVAAPRLQRRWRCECWPHRRRRIE